MAQLPPAAAMQRTGTQPSYQLHSPSHLVGPHLPVQAVSAPSPTFGGPVAVSPCHVGRHAGQVVSPSHAMGYAPPQGAGSIQPPCIHAAQGGRASLGGRSAGQIPVYAADAASSKQIPVYVPETSAEDQLVDAPALEALVLPDSTSTKCPKGHQMSARLVKEIWQTMFSLSKPECFRCKEMIHWDDARYFCRECQCSLCLDCQDEIESEKPVIVSLVRGWNMTPALRPLDRTAGQALAVRAGDILLMGPDMYGIHHVILCTGELQPADNSDRRHFGLKSHMELWQVPTIQSSRPLEGKDTAWYPSVCFIIRDLMGPVDTICGDEDVDRNNVNIYEQPYPFKLLIHPFRKSLGLTPIDQETFRGAVGAMAAISEPWNHLTGLKALGTMTVSNKRAKISESDYSSSHELVQAVRRSWATGPICSSVAVKTWQKYFELKFSSDVNQAAGHLLKYMPLWCDKTTPSMLTKVLSTRHWLLYRNLDRRGTNAANP